VEIGTRKWFRYIAAVTTAVLITMTSVAPAPAGAASRRTDSPAVPRTALLPSALVTEPPIIVRKPGVASVLGYYLVLKNSSSYAMDDTSDGRPGAAGPRVSNGNLPVILDNSAGGLIVLIIATAVKNRQKAWKFIKGWWYKGRHLYTNAGTGQCVGAFRSGQDVSLVSCSDKSGIFWHQTRNDHQLNITANADLIASGLTVGSDLFLHSAKDWSTWAWWEVCSGSC
jgi:hypothetical protein